MKHRHPVWRPLLALALFPAVVRADLDPELSTPYKLDVVLDIAKHRLLTDVFRQQVQRELQDGLRAAFGALAAVEVHDEHPKLAEVRKQGLKDALDAWNELTGVKTHFVQVDYAGGQYELRTRQHCGLTGQPSPIVRRARTSDRQFVARLAALLVDTDFGPVGTLPDNAGPENVRIQLKGGQLGVPMGRWVKKGEIFLVVPIPQQGQRAPQLRLDEGALLQVVAAPQGGACDCRLFSRYKNPLSWRGARGYRCLKLETVHTPLRVRLMRMGSNTPTPVPTQIVQVRSHGFGDKENPRQAGITDIEGYLVIPKEQREHVFERIAFVTVGDKKEVKAQVPVPLVDDRPVVLRVPPEPEDNRGLLALDRDLWQRQVVNASEAQRGLFEELRKLGDKPEQRAETLKRAKEGLEAARSEWTRLQKERGELLQKAQEDRVTIDVAAGDEWLRSLEQGNTKLGEFITAVEKIQREENDPKRKAWRELIAKGQLEEKQANFGEALAHYDRALEEFDFKDDELKKHRDELKAKWEPKGEEHRKARLYIYGEWPKADLVKQRDAIKQARAALAECRRAGDVLSPLKLFQVALDHGGKLQQQKDALQLDISEDDRNTAAVIAEVSQELKDLINALQAYLQEHAGEKK